MLVLPKEKVRMGKRRSYASSPLLKFLATPLPAGVANCSPHKTLASFMKQKPAKNKANEVFEILPLIMFVHHAGGMQTRSTPFATVVIWSLTSGLAP